MNDQGLCDEYKWLHVELEWLLDVLDEAWAGAFKLHSLAADQSILLKTLPFAEMHQRHAQDGKRIL